MKRPDWFERGFQFGYPPGMLPFFLERLEGTIARLEKIVGKLLMNPVDLAYFDAEHDDHHLVRIREIREAFNVNV